jgi:hypothetical protein
VRVVICDRMRSHEVRVRTWTFFFHVHIRALIAFYSAIQPPSRPPLVTQTKVLFCAVLIFLYPYCVYYHQIYMQF